MSTATITAAPSRAVPSARLHLTRRGRAVLTTLAAIPIVAAAAMFALQGSSAEASGTASHASYDYVTVHAGQSLWQIAETVAPSADPRDVISDIVTLNGLHSVEVIPGQRLAIPPAR